MTMPTTPSYVDRYDPDQDFDRHYTDATARLIRPWLRSGDHVLELGCATGLMTSLLVDTGARFTSVDRYDAYLQRARARALPRTTWIEGDVLDVGVDSPVDHAIVSDLLHELPDPGALLARCAGWLGAGGLLHLTVPNPNSLHRLVAMEMGVLGRVDELSENSLGLGHVGHLDATTVLDLAGRAGLTCLHREGVMVKPLPNAAMAELPSDVVEGFIRAAHLMPERCAMNHFVMTPTVASARSTT